jgi:alpha-N-arabinofuranosidase
MRDALVACINLNIFNKHADRVKMACIAQMINVLQAVILTEGPKMVKTPTWHVFDLFKEHQDATLVESCIETKMIGEEAAYMVPNLSESASVDAEGRLHVTIGNLSVTESSQVDAEVAGLSGKSVKARILTGEMHAKNTFDAPDAVHSEAFEVKLTEEGFTCVLPPASVVQITIEE